MNSINPNTHTPLIVAAYSQQAAVVRELLDRKADASIREGYSKSTALHKAAFYGNEEIVRMLTEAKASVHCVNASPSRVTPLHCTSFLSIFPVTTTSDHNCFNDSTRHFFHVVKLLRKLL